MHWSKTEKAIEIKNKIKAKRALQVIPKRSEETRKTISIKMMGNTSAKGILKTDEWKKKASDRMKGNKNGFKKGHIMNVSIETRKKISLSKIGKKLSQEQKDKIFTSEYLKRKSDFQKGEKGSNWRGGITPESAKIRNSLELKLWRKSCMERDNFTCQKTGIRGGILRVHHINNFSSFPELRTSIENGITLSDGAHREFHKKYGRKNNTLEQLIEFLK